MEYRTRARHLPRAEDEVTQATITRAGEDLRCFGEFSAFWIYWSVARHRLKPRAAWFVSLAVVEELDGISFAMTCYFAAESLILQLMSHRFPFSLDRLGSSALNP